MRLIDTMRQQADELAGRGLRPTAWKLDAPAIRQLRREAMEDGIPVRDATSPPTFLEVPIQEAPMGPAQVDFAVSHRRLVPCHHPDRRHGRQWNLFDLATGEAYGSFYQSDAEAEREAVLLEAGRR